MSKLVFTYSACLILVVLGCLKAAPVLGQADLQKCIKIRTDIKIDHPLPTNADFQLIFEKGVVISGGGVSDDECSTGGILGDATNNCLSHAIDLSPPDPNLQKIPAEVQPDSPIRCWTEYFGLLFVLNIVLNITNWAFIVLMSLAVIMFVYAGFLYLTAGGDPGRSTKGKQVLTFAIIGLALAFLAKIAPGVVKYIMGVVA